MYLTLHDTDHMISQVIVSCMNIVGYRIAGMFRRVKVSFFIVLKKAGKKVQPMKNNN